MRPLNALLAPLAAVGLAVLCGPAAAQEKKPVVDQERVDKSIALGLEYLRKNQSSDGSWSAQGGMYPTTMTGMAGVALLMEGRPAARGSTPRR